MTQKPRYYADLNPRFGANYHRRYVVWQRPDEGGLELPAERRPLPHRLYEYDTLKGATNAAERLNEQDRRDLGEV